MPETAPLSLKQRTKGEEPARSAEERSQPGPGLGGHDRVTAPQGPPAQEGNRGAGAPCCQGWGGKAGKTA